jgi:hypothetical protein
VQDETPFRTCKVSEVAECTNDDVTRLMKTRFHTRALPRETTSLFRIMKEMYKYIDIKRRVVSSGTALSAQVGRFVRSRAQRTSGRTRACGDSCASGGCRRCQHVVHVKATQVRAPFYGAVCVSIVVVFVVDR